jgi:argininosuccinate lyase
VAVHTVPQLQPTSNIMADDMYRYAFSVDRVNDLVKGGLPFRDAYKQVAEEIASGEFDSSFAFEVTTHSEPRLAALGSPSNPGLEVLRERLAGSR